MCLVLRHAICGEVVKFEDMVMVEKGGFRRLSLYPFESALLA